MREFDENCKFYFVAEIQVDWRYEKAPGLRLRKRINKNKAMRIGKMIFTFGIFTCLLLAGLPQQAQAQSRRNESKESVREEKSGLKSIFKKENPSETEVKNERKTLNFLHKDAKKEVKATKKERKAAEKRERAARARAEAIQAEKRAARLERQAQKANAKAEKARGKASSGSNL